MKYILVAVVALAVVTTLAVGTATTAEAAPAPQIQAYHTVLPGQTVFCIARGYKVNPWSIAYANHLTNPNYVVPGQTLAIPAGPYWYVPGPTCAPGGGLPPTQPPAACVAYHTVYPGQTLYSISLQYGVGMWAIAQANGIQNPNYIQAGQKLCIPGGGQPGKPTHPTYPEQPG